MKKEPRITLLSEFAPILNTKKGLITMYQTYSTNMVDPTRLELATSSLRTMRSPR